ncbi:hypothetical protein Tco_1534945, partial [Tanacetum coccineum]
AEKEGKVDTGKALDASLVITESSRTEFEKQNTRNSSGNDAYNAYIKPVYEEEPMAETYKDLYDSIKKTRVQTKDHNDSLIAQLNKKSIKNADLKAQIQEKVFTTASLKNELRNVKGTSVDTKFVKPSILGKLVFQSLRN